MTKNSNRKGLALGAIFALVASLFATAPAAQANEAGLVVEPIVGTSYTMVNTEDFILSTRLGSQVQADRVSTLKYIIAKSGTVGYGVSISQTVSPSATAMSGAFPGDTPSFNAGSTVSSMVTTSTVSVAIAAVSPTSSAGSKNQLRVQLWSLSALTSASPAATVTVTAFLDLNGDGAVTGTEPATTVEISFVRSTAMGASVALTQPIAGDTRITASAALSGINHQQLSGTFEIKLTQTGGTSTTSTGITAATLAGGNYSVSHDIIAATASATIAQSLSATLYYGAASDDEKIVATQRLGVTGTTGFDGFTFSATVGDNLVYTASNAASADIRVNSPATLSAWAFSGSDVATSRGTSWWFAVSGLSTDKFVVVNGVTYTNSATLPTASTAIAVAAGTKGAISLRTVGFTGDEVITFTQRLGDKSATFTVNVKAPVFTLTSDAGNFAVVQPGASTAYAFTVKDQFGAVSNRVNQRIAAYSFAATRFSTSETVSANVVAGKASVTVSTLPATATGSATVRATLQRQDENTGSWVNVSGVDISLTVTTSAAIFSGRVTPTSSAVSISYGTAYSWSADVTVPTNVAGAVVTVTATGLLIQDTTAKVTASNTLVTRAASGGNLVLKFAGAKAGTYTVSYAVGSATTTSQVVVQPAVVSNAATVTLDKSTLVPGQTNTVVATLVDANGNGIETAASNLVLAYSGKGLPFNITNVATDEDGKITFQVLVLAGESGTGTVTATIKPTTAAKDNITVVRSLTIVEPAAVAAPEINAVIGTFNGRWAVRVENAKGAVVSVKVGNRWVKYSSLNDNYLFSRKSRVGATLPVAVYVNGQLENVATITIK